MSGSSSAPPDILPPLADPADLALVSLGVLPELDARALLSQASAAVRSFCGWAISEHDYELDIDSAGDRVIMLPAMHVTAVTEISVGGYALVDGKDFIWSANGTVEYLRGRWPYGRRHIYAEFTAGYDPVPGDVVAAVCSLAAGASATRGGFTSQRIGSLSLGGYGAGLGDGAIMDPYAVLSRYKLP